jgi:hypothetical protein
MLKLTSRINFIAAAILSLSGCGGECKEYSDFSCKEIEEVTYNTYFYYPSGTEKFLGIANGLSQCGNMSYSFASSKKLEGNAEWSYICCMKVEDSECYEKHR